ncbi:MAG TPA: FAD-binding protein [Bacteroidia bacterium]|nr:FAD-binding protein [Bacteroidia bacterium]
MIINRTGKKQWTNRHETFTQNIDNLYNLADDNTGNTLNDYNDATTGIQGIIKEAIDANKHLRAMGGEWSWTKIAATDGILLNTKPLNITFRISQNNVSPSYAKTPDDLYFSQCGVSVKELNDRLRIRNRSLKTSGASNGQTIAGALSTGTHGSAIDIGAIPEFVVGLHIIVSPTRHVWLERSSYPVVSDTFKDNIHAELIRNDDLFNAALVSFGSFGFIHGVMIETDPLFLYEAHRIRLPLDNKLYQLMETLDFTNSALPHGSERPYHFQVLINQFDTSNQAYTTVMYKRPFDPAYTPPSVSVPGIVPGDDAPTFIGTITQALPALVPIVVNKLIPTAYKPFSNVLGTHGEMFSNTDTHGKVLSAAIGIPLDQVTKVRELFLSLNKSVAPFAGVIAFRYVKGTKATLGFTRFDKTCIIELDGVFSSATNNFYLQLWGSLDALNIPYTFHWGKILELNPQRIRKMYGNNIDKWIAARNQLMNDGKAIRAFNNDLLKEWGLDTITVPV